MTEVLSGNFLVRVSLWLRRRPAVVLGLIVGYTAFILLMHDHMVNLSIYVMEGLSLEVYNIVVAGIMIATAVFGGGWVIWNLWKHRERRNVKLFFLLATLGLFVVHALTMFEMNIEIIHAAQFGLAGFLWYALTGRAGAALILTLPIMLLDEWYQMNVLYPGGVEYLELNDVVLDLLGVGLMSVLLWIAGVPAVRKSVLKRPELYVLWAMIIGGAILLATGLVVKFPSDRVEHTWLILNSLADPDAFWQIHPFSKAKYHVLSLNEAVLVILGLIGFYGFSDEWR